MSTYEHETRAATDMLCEACSLDGMWTRAERLAEAQVHATLAVAAAGWAQAGMFPDALTAEEIENAEFDLAEEAAMQAEVRDRLAAHWTSAMCSARKSEHRYAADCLAEAIAYLRAEGPADTFTGSERADEVGA